MMNENLISSFAPIPLNPPDHFFTYERIPDIGVLMQASFFADDNFSRLISAKNKWWMGEKYDGIRVCWNPVNNNKYSRSGTELFLQDSVMKHFPNFFIDGEAWFGRGGYTKAQALFTSVDLVKWKYFRVLAFDDPEKNNFFSTFEIRYKGLLSIDPSHPFICKAIAFRSMCTSVKQLLANTKNIIHNDGEGVILRKPLSLYEHGRSNNLIKVKAARGDSEAIVMEVKSSYVSLKLPEETIFKVPLENIHTKAQLKKGDVVSFSYSSYSRYLIPKNPQILRIRSDLTWKEVLHKYSLENTPKEKEKYSIQPKGHWNKHKEDNFRNFFEEFARSNNMDPLNPEIWHNITREKIKEYQGGATIVNYARGGLVKTLMAAFPDIGLDIYKFKIIHSLLKDIRTRRKWFINYAKTKGMHPFVAENWYKIDTENILSHKGGAAILRHHSQNFATAVIHLFPEVKFDPTKFLNLPYGYLKDNKNRKRFFEEFAHKMNFDPLVGANWYKITHTHISDEKRGNPVLAYYNGNYVQALCSVFPNIGLDETKFTIPKSYWMQEDNRKWFFNTVAKKLEFDPKISDNWYSVHFDTIMFFTGASSVLQFYNGNWIIALVSLFPSLELHPLKFHHYPSSLWQNMENKRWIFQEYSKQLSFDYTIAENWYPHLRNIYPHKAIQGILNQYNKSVRNALLDIFPEVSWSNFPKIPSSYYDDIRNRQTFFKQFAEAKGFNLLLAENWYSIPLQSIRTFKAASVGLKPYGGNVVKALVHLFPQIGLDESKFSQGERWQKESNRKEFFENFARQRNFDPYVLENWSTITRLTLSGIENANGLNEYYGDQNIATDITNLFYSSDQSSRKYWANIENQKSFLMNFAKTKGFDPLDPEGWYNVTIPEFCKYHKAKSLVEHYSGSLIKALFTNFPDIGLDASKFSTVPKNYWQNKENRKTFFETFAMYNKFDPLNAAKWYEISKRELYQQKGGYGVLGFYKKNIVAALQDVFPDIDINPEKFIFLKKNTKVVDL